MSYFETTLLAGMIMFFCFMVYKAGYAKGYHDAQKLSEGADE